MNQIAQTYAEALFSIGLDEKKITKLQDEGKALSEIIYDNEDFLLLLNSRFLDASERKDIFIKVFKNFTCR